MTIRNIKEKLHLNDEEINEMADYFIIKVKNGFLKSNGHWNHFCAPGMLVVLYKQIVYSSYSINNPEGGLFRNHFAIKERVVI